MSEANVHPDLQLSHHDNNKPHHSPFNFFIPIHSILHRITPYQIICTMSKAMGLLDPLCKLFLVIYDTSMHMESVGAKSGNHR